MGGSLTGQSFTGCALERLGVGPRQGTRVSITGSGYIIGDDNIYVDERDPLTHGYSVE